MNGSPCSPRCSMGSSRTLPPSTAEARRIRRIPLLSRVPDRAEPRAVVAEAAAVITRSAIDTAAPCRTRLVRMVTRTGGRAAAPPFDAGSVQMDGHGRHEPI